MSERANKRTSELPNTKVALSACIILHCATKRAREQIFSLLSRRAEETRTAFTFLGATKHLYKMVCPSVHWSVGRLVGWSFGPLRLLILGGFGVLWSTAWPVLALVYSSLLG